MGINVAYDASELLSKVQQKVPASEQCRKQQLLQDSVLIGNVAITQLPTRLTVSVLLSHHHSPILPSPFLYIFFLSSTLHRASYRFSLLIFSGFLAIRFSLSPNNKQNRDILSYCERRELPSQSYGTPKKRNKIFNIGRRTILYKNIFLFFFNFELIPNMNRPGPAKTLA